MSKTVRTGAQASAGGGRPRDKTATGAARAQAGKIPSTLDPDLEQEINDIESEIEIEQRDEDSHLPPEDEIPEEEIADEVVRAAEGLPAEVPVDKADRTDEREEQPPHPPRTSED
ncbi:MULTISPECIES: hypothetical protein [unclassified Cupriavidus]|uniref:hypothetical protein n=1 Tax=unclassified Cupriavidus TaxID=2640874 RepID=UPI0004252B60|nr:MULTISPECIES: hypothetical protein [unclassified Cupriavidus]